MLHLIVTASTRFSKKPTVFMLYIKELIVVALLAIIVVGNLVDIVFDYADGASFAHMGLELILAITSFILIAMLSLNIWQQKSSNKRLKAEIEAISNTENNKVPAEVAAARHSLAKVIQDQFTTWSLTATEEKVAMLLLKGLSFKEIASVRSTSEKTVRQHASSLYKKAGVSGRHEFSAWFIEDYL